MQYLIRMTDDALESLALAGIEAYCLGGGNCSGSEQSETFGYVWGYRKHTDNLTTIYVSKVSVSVSACRSDSFVIPNPQALLLKDNFIARWSPHLSFLGEFHSHPFDDLKSVRETCGFEFTEQDIDSFVCDDHLWNRSDRNPIMLVITICRLSQVRETWCSQPRANVFSFAVGEFRFWLNAVIGSIGDDDNRMHSRNRRSSVTFDLDSRFFNAPQSRIFDLASQSSTCLG